MALATFVHISDLHFGDVAEGGGRARDDDDSKAARIWAHLTYFDGLLGHSYRALKQLVTIFGEFKMQEQAKLIVTGDLTTVGRAEQFRFADEFLSSKVRLSGDRSVGLSESDWKNRAIPGNHDHWPGSARILGNPTHALKEHFPNLPFTVASDVADCPIRFIGINTDDEVHPFLLNRALARGSFQGQLDRATELLRDSVGPEIRVLLLHQSYCQELWIE